MSTGRHKPAAMYGITHSPKGWKVQLKREKVQLFKQFCFSTCGGEDAALIRAQAWRDEMVKLHPPMARQQRASKPRRTNTSGIPGVTCQLGLDGEPKAWIAETTLSREKKLKKYFSVSRYGPEAKLLAIAERQKQLQHMTGRYVVHPAEAMVREAPSRPIPPDCPTPLAAAEIVRRHNQTGISGVQRFKPNPGYWCARTSMDGKVLTKFFSIKTYGEEKAKELAIAERQRQLEQVQNLSASGKGSSASMKPDRLVTPAPPRVGLADRTGIVGLSVLTTGPP